MISFEEIRKALSEDIRVTLVGVKEPHFIRQDDAIFPQAALYVAPKLDLYTAESLQTFMESLLPGFVPDQKENFVQHDTGLEIGRLVYFGSAGEEKIVTTKVYTFNDAMPKPIGYTKKIVLKSDRTIDLPLGIVVCVYPNAEFATHISQAATPYYIPVDLLQTYTASLGPPQ